MNTQTKYYEMQEDKEYSDEIVTEVIDLFKERSDKGIKKYGTTLEKNSLTLSEWLQHGKEEAMDMALYIHKAQKQLNG